MASPLTDRWLEGLPAIPMRDEGSLSLARTAVRERASAEGLDEIRTEAIATAVSELGRNQLRHARRGRIAVHALRRDATQGIEVVCADEGRGIADPAAAFREERPASGGLGAGLGAVLRLADEVDFDVRLEEGTCVRARKFAAPIHRSEIAVFGRPHEGLKVSGDDAAFVTVGDARIIAVADGLGHGEEARDASSRAMAFFGKEAARPVGELLRDCGVTLEGTRGVVMSVAAIEAGRFVHAGVGNVEIHLYSQARAPIMRFIGTPGVLGGRPSKIKIRVDEAMMPERCLLVAFTDGLSSRLDATDVPDAFTAPPLVVAQRLLERFGKKHDDAMVIVAR